MRYTKFTIHEYRGISSPIEIDVSKSSIIPIIGVNECGKTTILEALLAFDHDSDSTNDERHLTDVNNLYSFKQGAPRVSATISATRAEIEANSRGLVFLPRNDSAKRLLAKLIGTTDPEFRPTVAQMAGVSLKQDEDDQGDDDQGDDDQGDDDQGDDDQGDDDQGDDDRGDDDQGDDEVVKEVKTCVEQAREFMFLQAVSDENVIVITRDLVTRDYACTVNDRELNFVASNFVKKVLAQMDFILYFDDFRHQVPTSIKLIGDDVWTGILRKLFHQAHNDLDLANLPQMDERIRKSAMARAETLLNETLTRQWQSFHLEDRDALKIQLTYHHSPDPSISFQVAETTSDGTPVFFNIMDRSKGFFWFFNFVMRLEFNPKTVGDDGRTVYLLDEPGSYLHTHAQERLCVKLRELSKSNTVIYCTHSHHLLSPKRIPFNAIRIAERDQEGRVQLYTVATYPSEDVVKRSTFQPVLDALQIRPSAFDMHSGKVLVTEGVYDFFAFDLLKPADDVTVVPSVNADSIKYHVSLLMAWHVDYYALWDNDREGLRKRTEAEQHFGAEEASRRFKVLPIPHGSRARKRILQDLFDGSDIVMLRQELNLHDNASFKKVLLGLYYSPDRELIVRKISQKTRSAFAEVFEQLWNNDSL